LAPIKILLVDDDIEFYSMVQKTLARDAHIYEVERAPAYDTALEIVRRKHYEIYLVSDEIEENSGLPLVRTLIETGVDAPILLVTVDAPEDFDLTASEIGAVDYLDKNVVTPAALRKAFRYALQSNYNAQALRDTEANYRTLLEEASDGILLADSNGNILETNSAFQEMAGLPHDEIVGKQLSQVMRPTSPKAKTNTFQPHLLSPGETVIAEQLVRNANGQDIPVEINAKVVAQGRVQCIIRDIRHRKEADEERERYIQRLTILQQVDVELNQMLSVDYVLSLALDAAVRLSAAKAGYIGTMENDQILLAQAIGRYGNLLPGDVLPEDKPIRDVINSQDAIMISASDDEEIEIYISDNPQTRARMIIPLVSYKRLIGVLNLETNQPERFNQDVFDFIKIIASRVTLAIENAQLYQLAQDQLLRMQELYGQVSELEKLKTDMIRIAAHDLRNPIGVVSGYLELLAWSLGQSATPKQLGQIETMTRAVERMERITRDILSLERIEKMHMERAENMDFIQLFSEVVEDFHPQAELKKQGYEHNVTIRSAIVRGDAAQLREAAGNLISNAIKYTPETGHIKVNLRQDKDLVIFEVIDNGYGIPDDQQAGLFQPFYRASSDETADIEGSGLGLHLVKNIITRHGGKMIFHSVYGEGSTFGFQIPLSTSNYH
jgi:PAS domain S-box-containing protein